MNSPTLLVTGGAGMIGSNLVNYFSDLGWDVWVVDDLWRGSIANLQAPNHFGPQLEQRFLNLDLRIPGVLDELPTKVDFMVHLADIVAGINYVFRNEGQIFRDNILINSNTLASARKLKPQGLLYVGTACSFPKQRLRPCATGRNAHLSKYNWEMQFDKVLSLTKPDAVVQSS